MNTGRSIGLWIAAAVLLVAAGAFYFVGPRDSVEPAQRDNTEELKAAVARAATYYEFGHYERAVETYRLAIDRGMRDGADWYRYAYALEVTNGLDLDAYLTAYQLLLEQDPDHEYLADIRDVLERNTEEFDYERARSGELPEHSLVRVTGTITRIDWGRVESGRDTLVVATRPDQWIGHMGDNVKVDVPRARRYQTGQMITVLGRYEGWGSVDDNAGISRHYPIVVASGVDIVRNQ